MQLIERRHINTLKWDELVRNSEGDVFSFSWYLDSIAREWCVITDDDYTCGIAIPYTHKFGVKLAYIPVFSRYTDWFGPTDNQEIAVKIIDNSFAGYDLRLRSYFMLQNEVTIVHQNILSGRVVLGGQAKRMLNKAAKKDYIVRESLDFSFALAIIAKELTGKFKGIDHDSIRRLKELCHSASIEKKLRIFSIKDVGAIICIQSENKLLYLKGATTKEGKKNGAMYKLMKTAIDSSIDQMQIFDFGGSNLDGVRKFNRNLGGEDEFYFGYSMNKAPFWYNLLLRIKHKGNY